MLFDFLKPAEEITAFEIVTLHTSGMRHVGDWEIVMKDGEAEITEYGLRYEDGNRVRVPGRRATCGREQALEVLNACRLTAWDGFNGKHPRGVLDGTVFRLTATVTTARGVRTIEAGGSQNFPRGYDVLRDFFYNALRGK